VPADGTNSVHLYEVYADQAALDVHVSTPHMAEYRRDTDSMIAERIRVPCKVLVD
jgi:quinol monooxygenase YgiN